MTIKKIKLGDKLIKAGLITEETLINTLNRQRESGLKLGEQLIADNILTEKQIFAFLEGHIGIKHIDLNSYLINPKASEIITYDIAKKHLVLPVNILNGKLIVAMADPLDLITIDYLESITNMEVTPYIASRLSILNAIELQYNLNDVEVEGFEIISNSEIEENDDDEGIADAPMVMITNKILLAGVKAGASDIHIEPYEKVVRIRQRIDGDLREFMTSDKSIHSPLVTRIKIMGKMDIAEKRVPQDGRIETILDNHEIDMRISVLPTVYGEKVVIRLLDRSALVTDKSKLGFSQYNLDLFNKILKSPEGMVLVTGPTGSGKTTTLY
ncbi:MAG: Flp pilus assembly complex ATPase component TadA, partial [Clostridiales bacterium]|nr:Flp pilus assembly complex ATPase component TadA [Clostridiales bacterium]